MSSDEGPLGSGDFAIIANYVHHALCNLHKADREATRDPQ